MDYKSFIDQVSGIASVISVDLTDLRKDFTLVAANPAYIATVVDDPAKFKDHVPYTTYIRKDFNFDSMCLRCVEDQKPVHAYVDADFFNAWLDVFLLPLKSDDPNLGYCLFSYQMSPKAEAGKLADMSPDTALCVLTTCIKLRETKDFQSALDSIMEDICLLCDSSRCCILLTDFENRKCNLLCEAVNPERPSFPIRDIFTNEFINIAETWPKLIDQSNCFIIQSEADWDRVKEVTPTWYDSLIGAKVTNLVIYPMKSGDETIGYIWAANFDEDRTLKIKETLEVTTFILSAEIANHEMIQKMQILSSTDLLTGVKNRNAMNNRILDNDTGTSEIKSPFAAFFVDVNGLKTTNDTKGHVAGDNLLKDVADTLKEIFSEYEVYRVGGDEFLVIAPDCSKEVFDSKKSELLSKDERPHRAHYAVGACHSTEVADNIRKAMQLADQRMYENKEEYYSRHPEYAWDRRTAEIKNDTRR